MEHPIISFKNVDGDELLDVFGAISYSLNVSFTEAEAAQAKTFGELCDTIAEKIPHTSVSDCTTQQAFYKLRSAFAAILPNRLAILRPSDKLNALLPWKNRRKNVKLLEAELGFSIELLQPASWLATGALLVLLTGLALLAFNRVSAIEAIAGALILLKITIHYGKRLDAETVGALAEKMAIQHNHLCRRNPSTYNKIEVEQIVRKLFAEMLSMDESLFVREAAFA